MEYPGNRNNTRLMLPVKVFGQRFLFLFFLGLSAVSLFLTKAQSPIVDDVRTVVVDSVAPVLDMLSRPVSAVNYAIDQGRQIIFLHEENTRLREETDRLTRWQTVARNLEQENAVYRALLNIKPDARTNYITARVIGDSGGPFVRTLLLNGGREDGVENGQAVVNGQGVVGRVVATGRRSARVLLLTDLNSRVPIVLETSRHRGVLAGDNDTLPRLNFLPVGATVRPGERVLTSGHGGLFPPGLPVGVVTSVAEGVIRVQPFVDRDRVEFVRALRFVIARDLEDPDTAIPVGSLQKEKK